MLRKYVVGVFIACVLFAVGAMAQDGSLETLTEDALIDQFHREAYRAEFFRRLPGYTQEERVAALEKFADVSGRRRFPEEYTEDELFEHVRRFGDSLPAFQALDELELRYKELSPENHNALFARLRAEYRAHPYPIDSLETVSDPVHVARREVYYGLDAAAKRLLPEQKALELFREVYLESGQKGAVTRFLSSIKGTPFTGAATRAVLEELAVKVGNYDQSTINEMGEHESLLGILGNRIRQCSDNSFEAVAARDWQENSADIYAMGRFEEPEAREMLLAYYDTMPDDYRYCDNRLQALSALITRWDRERDLAFRQLLRRELIELLNLDHNRDPFMIGMVADVIGKTRDPYFIPVLEKRRADLDLPLIRRLSTLPEDQLEDTIKGALDRLGAAIEALEEARRGDGS